MNTLNRPTSHPLNHRFAALCLAREKLLQSEQGLAQARHHAMVAGPNEKDAAQKAVKIAETQVEGSKKNVAAVEKTAATASDTYTPLGPVFPKTSTGRRRALAQWIASRENAAPTAELLKVGTGT